MPPERPIGAEPGVNPGDPRGHSRFKAGEGQTRAKRRPATRGAIA